MSALHKVLLTNGMPLRKADCPRTEAMLQEVRRLASLAPPGLAPPDAFAALGLKLHTTAAAAASARAAHADAAGVHAATFYPQPPPPEGALDSGGAGAAAAAATTAATAAAAAGAVTLLAAAAVQDQFALAAALEQLKDHFELAQAERCLKRAEGGERALALAHALALLPASQQHAPSPAFARAACVRAAAVLKAAEAALYLTPQDAAALAAEAQARAGVPAAAAALADVQAVLRSFTAFMDVNAVLFDGMHEARVGSYQLRAAAAAAAAAYGRQPSSASFGVLLAQRQLAALSAQLAKVSASAAQAVCAPASAFLQHLLAQAQLPPNAAALAAEVVERCRGSLLAGVTALLLAPAGEPTAPLSLQQAADAATLLAELEKSSEVAVPGGTVSLAMAAALTLFEDQLAAVATLAQSPAARSANEARAGARAAQSALVLERELAEAAAAERRGSMALAEAHERAAAGRVRAAGAAVTVASALHHQRGVSYSASAAAAAARGQQHGDVQAQQQKRRETRWAGRLEVLQGASDAAGEELQGAQAEAEQARTAAATASAHAAGARAAAAAGAATGACSAGSPSPASLFSRLAAFAGALQCLSACSPLLNPRCVVDIEAALTSARVALQTVQRAKWTSLYLRFVLPWGGGGPGGRKLSRLARRVYRLGGAATWQASHGEPSLLHVYGDANHVHIVEEAVKRWTRGPEETERLEPEAFTEALRTARDKAAVAADEAGKAAAEAATTRSAARKKALDDAEELREDARKKARAAAPPRRPQRTGVREPRWGAVLWFAGRRRAAPRREAKEKPKVATAGEAAEDGAEGAAAGAVAEGEFADRGRARAGL
jgi:hypothetical protein